MELAPVEWVLIGFDHGNFKGEILKELARLEQAGTIRVLDVVFVRKTDEGDVQAFELSADEGADALSEFSAVMRGLFSEEDILEIGEVIEAGSASALLAIEDTWARPLQMAIAEAGGVMLGNQRIPFEYVDEAIAEYEAL